MLTTLLGFFLSSLGTNFATGGNWVVGRGASMVRAVVPLRFRLGVSACSGEKKGWITMGPRLVRNGAVARTVTDRVVAPLGTLS